MARRTGGHNSHRVLRQLLANRSREVVIGSVIAILLGLIGMPLAFYVWGSFWSTSPGLGGHFTLEGYRSIVSPGVFETVSNTFIFAVVGTIIAVFFGVGGAIVAIKTRMPQSVIAMVLIIQYLLPAYIVALTWDFYASPNGSLNALLMALPFVNSPIINVYSVWGMALVAGAHYAGLVYLLTSGAIRGISSAMEETAMVGGASTYTILRRITLPLITPSLLIAVVLVFTRLLQSFGLPLILGVRSNVFVVSTHMYYSVQKFPPDFAFASALGMVILVISIVGLVAQRRISGSRRQYETIGGKGDTQTVLTFGMGKWKPVVGGAVVLTILFVYVFPYVVLVLGSFQSTIVGLQFHKATWTLENYATLFVGAQANTFYQTLTNTLIISSVGALLAMILCAIASYIIVKTDSILSPLTDILTLTPAAIPGIIVGIAFLWFFLTYDILDLYGTIWIIMIALASRFIVYGTRATNSSFTAIGTELEEAAYVSGADFLATFRKIFAPLIKPGFLAGYVLLFVDFMKVLTIPLLLGSSQNRVLSVLLWEAGVSVSGERAAAIAVVMVALVIGIYGVIHVMTDIDVTSI